MCDIIEVTDLDAPELDVYARLTQAQLRSRREPEEGLFIAESPKGDRTCPGRGLRPPLSADGAQAAGGTGPGPRRAVRPGAGLHRGTVRLWPG